MLEAIVEKFTESFNRQNGASKQFYNVQFLCIKTSLYRYVRYQVPLGRSLSLLKQFISNEDNYFQDSRKWTVKSSWFNIPTNALLYSHGIQDFTQAIGHV